MSANGPSRMRSSRGFPGAFAVVLIAAALLTANLGRYPAPWFDEGLNISTAGMLAREGTYGLPDNRGPRIMDAMIQTGPTVIVPVAVMFHLFGAGLTAARLVTVAFALVAVVCCWLIARRVFDWPTALAASACLLAGNTEPFTSFVYMGRQTIGEVPALALVMVGLLVTINSWSSGPGTGRRARGSALAGLAWGAAMVTKSQVFVLLPAALTFVCAADLFYYRRKAWPLLALSTLIGLSCVAAWYGVQYLVAGEAQFRANAELARQGFELHIFDVRLVHMRNAAGVLWRTGFLLWGVPGLLWGLHLTRSRDAAGLRGALVLAFPLIALAWYVGLSIGWARYAFYPFVMLSMWTANAAVGVVRRLSRERWGDAAAGVLAAFLLACPLAVGASAWSSGIVSPPPNGFDSMRRYLSSQIPRTAVVEMWEWELSLDGGPGMRHPSTTALYAAIAGRYSGGSKAAALYDASQSMPDYVLDGPFSGWTGIYLQLLQERGIKVTMFPPYALYRIRRDEP